MGCFNITCDISHLPITYGERIVLLPLFKKLGNNDLTHGFYFNDNYNLLMFPIFGIYDDYGAFETYHENSFNEEIWNNLNIKNGEDEKVSYEEFCEGFSSYNDLTFVNAKNMETYAIDYMVLHEELYFNILYEIKKRKVEINPEKHRKDYKPEAYYAFKKYISNTIDNAVQEYQKKCNFNNAQRENEHAILSLTDILSLVEITKYNQIRNIYRSIIPNGYYSPFEIIFEKILENKVTVSEKDFLVDLFVNIKLFGIALDVMRSGYLCTSGLGSQGAEYALPEVVAKFIISHTKDVLLNKFETNPKELNKAKREDIYMWID